MGKARHVKRLRCALPVKVHMEWYAEPSNSHVFTPCHQCPSTDAPLQSCDVQFVNKHIAGTFSTCVWPIFSRPSMKASYCSAGATCRCQCWYMSSSRRRSLAFDKRGEAHQHVCAQILRCW